LSGANGQVDDGLRGIVGLCPCAGGQFLISPSLLCLIYAGVPKAVMSRLRDKVRLVRTPIYQKGAGMKLPIFHFEKIIDVITASARTYYHIII